MALPTRRTFASCSPSFASGEFWCTLTRKRYENMFVQALFRYAQCPEPCDQVVTKPQYLINLLKKLIFDRTLHKTLVNDDDLYYQHRKEVFNV